MCPDSWNPALILPLSGFRYVHARFRCVMALQLRYPRTLLQVRTNLLLRTSPHPRDPPHHPCMPVTRTQELWRNSSMNRKTLVLPAVIGLLAPVLAACGGTDAGSGSSDAIGVGTTDRFTATKDAPAPLDPAYAYDVGTWNVLRQTVQTLMIQPKGDGEPVPEAAQSCGFSDSGNERYVCTLRDG